MQKIELLRLTAVKKLRDNNVMHAKPDLRVFLKWMITRSGSVITDVITLEPHLNVPSKSMVP